MSLDYQQKMDVCKMLKIDDPKILDRNGYRPLMSRLNRIDELCRRAGGRLKSRQIIAKEIMDWEDEV